MSGDQEISDCQLDSNDIGLWENGVWAEEIKIGVALRPCFNGLILRRHVGLDH